MFVYYIATRGANIHSICVLSMRQLITQNNEYDSPNSAPYISKSNGMITDHNFINFRDKTIENHLNTILK